MPYMFDTKTGQQIWVPDDKVESGWTSGRLAFPKGAKVNVNIGGDYTVVDESSLQGVFDSGGHYDMVSQRVLRHEEDYFEDQNLSALALGVGRGVGGKLSDAILVGLGADEERLEKFHQHNPVISGLGQAAGAIAPAVLSGGTGTAARLAVATPAGMSARAGAIAGAKSADLVADGMNFLRNATAARGIGTASGMAGEAVLQRSMGRAFSGAIEGATDLGVFGAFNLLGEELLGSPSTFAENAVSEIGVPAMIGGAIGGVLGGSGLSAWMDKSFTKLMDIQYGSRIPKDSKVMSLMESVADGDKDAIEALERIGRFVTGGEPIDEEFVAKVIGNKWGPLLDDAANDTVNLVKDIATIWGGKRAALPDVKEGAWANLIGKPSGAASTGGIAGENSFEAMGQSLTRVREVRDTLEAAISSSKAPLETSGLGEVLQEAKKHEDAIVRSLSEAYDLPKGVTIKYSSEFGEYRLFGVKTGKRGKGLQPEVAAHGLGGKRPPDLGISLGAHGSQMPGGNLVFTDEFFSQASHEVGAKRLAGVYSSLDQLKRSIQTREFKTSVADIGGRSMKESEKRTLGLLDGEQSGLASFLENTSVWGQAGEAQASINSAWSKMLTQEKQFFGAFGKRVKTKPGGDPMEEWTPSLDKARTYVKKELDKVDDLDGEPVVEIMGQFRDATKEWQGALSKWFGDVKIDGKPALTDDFRAASTRFEAADAQWKEKFRKLQEVKASRDVLFKVAGSVEVGSTSDTLKALVTKHGPAVAGGSVAGWGGFVVGGRVGTFMSKLRERARKPAERLVELTRLKSKQLQYRSRYEKTVKKTIDRMLQNKNATFFPGASKIKNTTWQTRWVPLLSINQSRWEDRSERKRTEEAIMTLSKWRADPASLQGRILVATSMLGGRAPQVQGAMQAQLTQMCNYLANNVPDGITITTDPFTGSQLVTGPDYSFGEFNDMVQTVDMGLDYIAKNLAVGTTTPHMVRVWKSNFPEEYSNFCSDLMTKSSPRKREMSYAMKSNVSILFQVPMDASLSPGNIQIMQSTWKARDEENEARGMGGTSRPAALKSMARNAETQSNRLLGPNSN